MPSKKGIYLLTAIGLLLGFALDWLIRNENTTAFNYALIILFSLLFSLAYDEKNVVRLAGSSLIFALFLSIGLIPIQFSSTPMHIEHLITFLCIFPLFVYVGHSFHYAYHQDNTWNISYSSLFAAVWNTFPLLFVAGLFSSLANLLIIMGAFIFKTVGSNYLWTLYFDNRHFYLIANATLFFMGLGVAQQNIKIIYNLRFILLKMMYYLFPFLAFISSLYFILFLSHSLSNAQEYINPLIILIPLTTLGIVFFNAYFQDGSLENGAPAWLKLFLRIYRIILFILVLMMAYKIFQKFSVDINVTICILIAILFTLTYAITAVCSQNMERKWIRFGNIATGLFFILSLFLLNLP